MSLCPRCQAPLDAAAIAEGRCSVCRATLSSTATIEAEPMKEAKRDPSGDDTRDAPVRAETSQRTVSNSDVDFTRQPLGAATPASETPVLDLWDAILLDPNCDVSDVAEAESPQEPTHQQPDESTPETAATLQSESNTSRTENRSQLHTVVDQPVPPPPSTSQARPIQETPDLSRLAPLKPNQTLFDDATPVAIRPSDATVVDQPVPPPPPPSASQSRPIQETPDLSGLVPIEPNQTLFDDGPPAAIRPGDATIVDQPVPPSPHASKTRTIKETPDLSGLAPIEPNQTMFDDAPPAAIRPGDATIVDQPVPPRPPASQARPIQETPDLFGLAPIEPNQTMFDDAPPAAIRPGDATIVDQPVPPSPHASKTRAIQETPDLSGLAPLEPNQTLFDDGPPAAIRPGDATIVDQPVPPRPPASQARPIQETPDLSGLAPLEPNQTLFDDAPPVAIRPSNATVVDQPAPPPPSASQSRPIQETPDLSGLAPLEPNQTLFDDSPPVAIRPSHATVVDQPAPPPPSASQSRAIQETPDLSSVAPISSTPSRHASEGSPASRDVSPGAVRTPLAGMQTIVDHGGEKQRPDSVSTPTPAARADVEQPITATITNFEPVDIEVARQVLTVVDQAPDERAATSPIAGHQQSATPVRAGAATIDMSSPHATIEATSLNDVERGPRPAAGGVTVDATGPNQTMVIEPSSGSGQDAGLGATLLERSAGGGRAIPGGPQPTLVESRGGASPGATAAEPTDDEALHSRSTLVIQPRAFREPNVTPNARADYDLLKKLGQGGMGVVYAARQASIDRTVAVKMLKPSMTQDASQRNKFLSEAVITGELEHPNIVPIYELGYNVQEGLFYAMKCVQGTPWDKVIREKSLTENLDILLRVCDAIAFAHSRGVIHRDLKPENTMLGGYGEVLVMDWGLALPFGNQSRSRAIGVKAGMGGTPAYMAPEMATGPFDQMGPASDIYLLGAILYEIITGSPPHQGRDVMKCLFAAARNEIVPTDKSGELVEIALRAMATKVVDRYPTVQDFQHAIRGYYEHAESIATSDRAEQELQESQQTGNYEGFSRAVFGFQEAVARWDGNTAAWEGVVKAKQAYAATALRRDDLDLAASLLDADCPEHAETRSQITAALAERTARQRRLKTARRTVIGLAAMVFVIVSVALVVTNQLRNQAVRAALAEADAKQQALAAAEAEAQAKRTALAAAESERTAKVAAQDAQAAESKARLAAQMSFEAEKVAKVEAIEARNRADEAREAEAVARREAEYEEYVALIGLAAANIEENAFGNARSLLEKCTPGLRNWEWRRLMHLCTQSVAEFPTRDRVHDLAFAPDGRRFAIATAQGIQIWDRQQPDQPTLVFARGEAMEAVAWSPVSELVAVGGHTKDREFQLWNAITGQLVATLPGHTEAVVRIRFSKRGDRLLTASLDHTARLWDTDSRRELGRFQEHDWLVWDAAFSGDERFVVTASHDGTARVWPLTPLVPQSSTSAPNRAVVPPHAKAAMKLADNPALQGSANRVSTIGSDAHVPIAAERPPLESRIGMSLSRENLPSSSRANAPSSVNPLPARSPNELGMSARSESVLRTVSNMITVQDSAAAGTTSAAPSATRLAPFDGHSGPVYAVAVSPVESLVVSGGYDKQLLLWRPDDLKPFDYQGLLAGRNPPRTRFEKLGEHASAIRSIHFSHDGKLLLTAGHDNTVKLWDVTTRRLLKSFRGHDSWVRAAIFSPDEQTVLSGGFDQRAKLWDVAGYEEVRVLQGRVFAGHTDAVLSAAFSQDDLRVVTASRDRTAKTFDIGTGKQTLSLTDGHAFLATTAVYFDQGQKLLTAAADDTVRVWNDDGVELLRLRGTGLAAAAAVSPDGRWIATGAPLNVAQQAGEASRTPRSERVPGTQVVRLWSAETGQLKYEWAGHKSEVTAVAFSPNGRFLYSGDANGRGQLWDLQTPGSSQRLDWHTSKITAAVFLPDGARLLTASDDNTVCQWDTRGGSDTSVPEAKPAAVQPLSTLALKHPDTVWSIDISRDGKRALTSCADGQARLWQLDPPQVVRSFQPNGGAISFGALAPDGQTALAVDTTRRTVHQWNLETAQERLYPDPQRGTGPCLDLQRLGGLVWTALFTPDGRDILTVGGNEARRWDVTTQSEVMSFSPHRAVASASFSSDQQQVVTASWDHSAKIWDATTGAPLRKLTGHTQQLNSALFSPVDKALVLTASDDRTARLWNANEERVIATLSHPAAVRVAAFSADGQGIVTGCDDGLARIWKREETAQPVLELRGHDGPILAAQFSRDGAFVVTGSGDNTARIWDVASGASLQVLAAHTAAVTAVGFSPDGTRVLTASEDFTSRLWDRQRGREIMNLKGHSQAVTSITFSSSGRYVLTASRDGTAILWLARE